MDGFWEGIGILAVFFVIVYSYKKILEHYDLKRLSFYADKKVYQAADAFAHGASSKDVAAILAGCLGFNERDAEEILSLSISRRRDKDGGYKAFIRSVNTVLGMDVYNVRYRTH